MMNLNMLSSLAVCTSVHKPMSKKEGLFESLSNSKQQPHQQQSVVVEIAAPPAIETIIANRRLIKKPHKHNYYEQYAMNRSLGYKLLLIFSFVCL